MKPPLKVDIYEGQILPWQINARDDTHRFQVYVAGRKARKTTRMVNRLMKDAMQDKRGLTYPYVAPYRQQGKEIVWHDHVARILSLCKKVGIPYQVNNSDLTVLFPQTGSRFQVTGQDNAEALRGKSDWGGIGVDEYESWRPNVWDEIIRPNLVVHKAYAMIGGTPKGYGKFYKMAKLGDHNNVIDDRPYEKDPDFMTFHTTSYANTFVDPKEFDAARRTTSPEFFEREYLATFTTFTGLIYPEFNIAKHVEGFEHTFDEYGDYYFSLDFATHGYTAGLTAKVKSDGHIYILEDYKEYGGTAKGHAGMMHTMLCNYASFDKYIGYGDPAGFAKTQQRFDRQQEKEFIWSIADEYLEEGFPLVKANNEVTAGINYVKQLFKADKIHIHYRCEKLIEELQQYQWKDLPEKQLGAVNDLEQPRKLNDHLCFAKGTIVNGKKIEDIGYQTGNEIVYEYEIAGEKLIATPNHPILTQRGFASIDTLRYNDVIWKKKLLFMQVSGGVEIQTVKDGVIGIIILAVKRLREAKERDYIDLSGKNKKELSLKDSAYITLMVIPATIQLIILGLLAGVNTCGFIILKKGANFLSLILRKLFGKQVSGQRHQKGNKDVKKSGRRIPILFSISQKLQDSVIFVRNSTRQKEMDGIDSATLTVVKKRCVGRVPVYNLRTKSGMYLANNILVSNCDCLRYLCYSKPIPPEELEAPRLTVFPAVFPLKIDKPDENADQFEEIEIPSIYD